MTKEPQVCLLRTWYCYRTAHVEECKSLRRSSPRSLAGPDQNQKLGRKIQGVRCRQERSTSIEQGMLSLRGRLQKGQGKGEAKGRSPDPCDLRDL